MPPPRGNMRTDANNAPSPPSSQFSASIRTISRRAQTFYLPILANRFSSRGPLFFRYLFARRAETCGMKTNVHFLVIKPKRGPAWTGHGLIPLCMDLFQKKMQVKYPFVNADGTEGQ